jgi:hypothetical protein
MTGILRIIEGCVYEYNTSGQKVRTFYLGKDAERADWISDEGVQVWLKGGKVYHINRNCQIFKRFPC